MPSGSDNPGDSHQQQVARDFLRRCAAGDVDAAYRLYVHARFIHHNPGFSGDRESLRRGMLANAAAVPGKAISIHVVLEDGDRVCTLSEVRAPGLRIAVTHVFRFQDGRIAELWDVGQPIPADSPNENGPF